MKLLTNTEDWRLVFSAAESLGKLSAEEALPILIEVSQHHWYSPVREAAMNAGRSIRREPTDSTDPGVESRIDCFSYENVGANIESLEENEAGLVRFPVKSRQRGRVKVEGSYLVGSDRGEWGGEITFVDLKGSSQTIASENTEAIYQTAQGLFAVTGLAHLSSNSGFIHRITKAADGAWWVEKWRALPGAPRFSRLLKDGSLFVSCYGGIALISAEGDIKSLTRSEALKQSAAPPK